MDRFDFALWMDSDNVLIEDTCEDMLGNLVGLRHGWVYTAGERIVPIAALRQAPSCSKSSHWNQLNLRIVGLQLLLGPNIGLEI